MFTGIWNLAIYLLVALLIFIDYRYGFSLTLYLSIPIVCLWDAVFVSSKSTFEGRDPAFILDQVIHSRTLISIFIPIYGVVIPIFLLTESGKAATFLTILQSSGISVFLVAIPLVLASLSLMLVPIHVKCNVSQETSNALKSLLFVCMASQKISLIIFLFILIKTSSQVIQHAP